jgi:DNA-binding NarL/FixJ family response regulator
MNETTLPCLVADDHPALAVAVASYLSAHGFQVLGPVADGDAAVALAAKEQPAIAVVDYRMPRLSGATLLERLREVSPETKLAVYTAEADETVVAEVLAAGGHAVVLKEAPLEDLARALASVLAGRPYVDPALARDTVLGGRSSRAPGLTEREIEVLRLLADGLSHDEIGARLSISGETVRTHVRKASDRLRANTRTQAVATALRLGLIA